MNDSARLPQPGHDELVATLTRERDEALAAVERFLATMLDDAVLRLIVDPDRKAINRKRTADVVGMLIKGVRPATLARDVFVCWAPTGAGLSMKQARELFEDACRAEAAK